MFKVFLISIGAMLGANARYWFGVWAATQYQGRFPLATFLINVVGSCLLGAIYGYTATRPNANLVLFAGVGFLGAFTTFSTFSVEIVNLWTSGNGGTALLYAASSVAAGVLGAWLSLSLMR